MPVKTRLPRDWRKMVPELLAMGCSPIRLAEAAGVDENEVHMAADQAGLVVVGHQALFRENGVSLSVVYGRKPGRPKATRP